MKRIVFGIGQRAVSVIGLGAVLVSTSEYWFYQVEAEVSSTMILLAYGLLGYLFIAVVQRFRVHSVAGLVVAASLLGFLIEGVPVPVVYANPPLSIVWTSLAWHAVLTLGLGWLSVRVVLADARIWRAIAINAAFGFVLGVWNAFMWNAKEVESTDQFTFVWQPTEVFATQFLFGYALFVGGHILLDRLYPKTLAIGQFEYFSLWVLVTVISVLVAYSSGLFVLFPILPALVLGCLLALQLASKTSPGGVIIIDRLYKERIPLRRFGLTGLIPVTAIAGYAGMVHLEVKTEMNVLLIVTVGPAAVAILLWSLFQIGRQANQAR